MTVCPALLPPWLRTTMSARAVSTSMILPLPSSPHCIPIKIVFAIEIRNGQKIFPMHPAGHSRDLPTDNTLARSPRKGFRAASLLRCPEPDALSVLNIYGCTARARQLRRGHLLVRSCRFCRGSSAWLLSSRFNHGRPNWADRFQLGTSRRGRARCALWLNLRFSFHRPRSLRDNWAWRRRFRVRRGCCGWLRNRSVIFPLRSKRSRRAHLVNRGRDGFLFA